MWLKALLLLAGGSLLMPEKGKRSRQQSWDSLLDASTELERATGVALFEMNHGTLDSLKAALKALNRAIAQAPTGEGPYGAESFARFRLQYVEPALEMKLRVKNRISDMRERGVKTAAQWAEAMRNRPPAGFDALGGARRYS